MTTQSPFLMANLPLLRKTIEIGGRDFGIGIVASNISICQVIREDVNDIGFSIRHDRLCSAEHGA